MVEKFHHYLIMRSSIFTKRVARELLNLRIMYRASLTLFATVVACRLCLEPAHSEIIAGKNLLTNGSGEAAANVGWTLTNGGSGWALAGGGYDATGGRFITSYVLCKRSQVIDLLAQGVTAAELDAGAPIRVSEAISCDANNGGGDTYYIRVELRNAAGGVVARWDAGTETARKAASTTWTLESFEFSGYGTGVRSIYFEDGGIDAGYWSGNYGTFHDAATVAFANQPVTDIVLTPANIPNAVPAGGIVGHLSAVDGDNAVHTFALEPAVVTSTVPLIAAGESGWRFLAGGVTPPTDWTAGTFDDSTWGSGLAPLGYDSSGADTWIATTLSFGGVATTKPFSVQLRKTFTVANAAAITALTASAQIDDGCIVYLNGQELFRDGMPTGAITNTTPANRTVGGADENDFDPVVITVDKLPLLTTGTNVLAVSLHQDKITSSDTTFDLNLSAVIPGSIDNYANDLFEISGSELRLKAGSAALPVGDYSVRVRATDPAGNTFAKLITINRANTNYPAAPTNVSLATTTVPENTPAGSLASALLVTDADVGQAFRYETVSGLGHDHNAMVRFYGNSVYLLSSPDFETQTAVKFRIRVTDSAGLSFTKPLELAITDVTTEDQDADGLTEAEEDLNGNGILDANETDPLVADTDTDGFSDRVERQAGSDPRDPLSTPSAIEMQQIVTHATGSSWLTATSWQGGAVPTAIHLAVSNNFTFRSPPSDAPVFPGIGVKIQNEGIFRLKHTGLCTIGRIILDNGTMQQGMTVPIGVGGPASRLEILTTGIIDTAAVQLDLSAGLAGSGIARFIGTGRAELLAPSAGFTGTVIVAGPVLSPAHATALNGTTLLQVKSGKLSLSQGVSVGDAVFGSVLVPPGSYSATQLVNLGVPASMVDDVGGTLTVAGTLASLDSDGDGQNDLFEKIAGTSPTDPADRLELASPAAPTGNTVLLEWRAVAGLSYTVQSTADLAGTWSDLGTVTPTTTSGSYTATLATPAPEKIFFRLVLK